MTSGLERSGPADERKVVTVLFCDLVGFSSRADQLDPEDVDVFLRRFHLRTREELEGFGATVEKFAGDAVMALFGAPVSHEDDAERAVRAALSICSWITEEDLQVRIGIATGEVLIRVAAKPSEGETMAVGDVVNTAARLQQLAPEGAVLVGEATYRATKQSIAYEPVDSLSVKGKADAVPVWMAKRVLSSDDTLAYRPTTPLIGRRDELELLGRTYMRVVREASAHLVTVAGEPGIGKTRLLTEFRGLLDAREEPAVIRRGRCLPYGDGVTFWALGQIVKEQAGILESDGPAAASEKLIAAVDAVAPEGQRQWLVSRLGPLVGSAIPEGTVEQEESFGAWQTFLEAVAARSPLVLVVEDLHWGGRAMLEFLQGLVEWVTEVPLLVIATARPELYERSPEWGRGKQNSAIALEPLPDRETTELVGGLLSGLALSAETHASLLERASGNPLFAEEYVRLVRDRGLPVQGGDIPVPETVQAVIAARIDTLSSERKQLLNAAAVAGKGFWAGALAAMTGRSTQSVLTDLQELGRKELVRRVRSSSIVGDHEFLFWHVLVRDVAYAQIPRAERARLHVLAAGWIEQISQGREGDRAEFLAYHYRTALDLTRATSGGADDAELHERAVSSTIAAGDRALHLDAAQAARFYREALDLLSPDDRRRARILVAWADASLVAGASSLEQIESDLMLAVEDFRVRGDEMAAADALRELSFLRIFTGAGPAERLAPLEEARQILERHPPTPGLARTYDSLVQYRANVQNAAGVLEVGTKALDLLERFGLRDEAAMTRSRILSSRGNLGDPSALPEFEALGRLVSDPASSYGPFAAMIVLNNLAASQQACGEHLARSNETLEEAVALSDARGLKRSNAWMKANSVGGLYAIGDWDRVLQRAGEVSEMKQAPPAARLLALPWLARVRADRGDVAGASSVIRELLPIARRQQDYLPIALHAAAVTAAGADDWPSATRLVEEIEAVTRSSDSRLDDLADVARICAGSGRLDILRRFLDGHAPVPPLYIPHVDYVEAVLADADRDHRRAEEMFDRASAAWRDSGYVVECGHALIDVARCRLALAGPQESLGPLKQAREIFGRLKARAILTRVDALLASATPMAGQS